jgi:4-hydroxybenzoate polyprenyltransferase
MVFLFCLASSGVYLINDIIDLESDRKHPQNKSRPLASGKITPLQACTAALVLFICALVPAFFFNFYVGLVMAAYLVLNGVYMVWLKNIVIVDVFCIGAFFYLRVLAGALTAGTVLSHWIILASTLLALFLGFNKRRFDLGVSIDNRPVYAKYSQYFIDRMVSIVSSSIVIAYALYTMDAQTIARFGTTHLFYTIPFFYYGLFRYMYLLDRGDVGGDPTRIVLKDHIMQLNIVLWLASCVAVIYYKI